MSSLHQFGLLHVIHSLQLCATHQSKSFSEAFLQKASPEYWKATSEQPANAMNDLEIPSSLTSSLFEWLRNGDSGPVGREYGVWDSPRISRTLEVGLCAFVPRCSSVVAANLLELDAERLEERAGWQGRLFYEHMGRGNRSRWGACRVANRQATRFLRHWQGIGFGAQRDL